MTWSIVARDDRTSEYGIACASRALAVGAVVPYGAGRKGALATQALANSFYGVDGLRLLQDGCSAQEIVAHLIVADAGRDHRQLHVVDRKGRSAAHTGQACLDWSGSLAEAGVSVAGNMLAGPDVLNETLAAYFGALDRDFDERLILAIKAGEKGGRRSARAAVLCAPDLVGGAAPEAGPSRRRSSRTIGRA